MLLLRRRRAGLLELRGIALRWLMRRVALLLRLCGRLAWLLLLLLRRGRVALVRGVALLLRRIALLLLLGCGRLTWLLLLLQLLGLLRVGLCGLLEALLR